MKRRHLAIGLVFAVVLAAVAGIVYWQFKPHPSWATFEKVQEGMSRQEVIATVGGLPDITINQDDGTKIELWDADDGALWVVFDRAGRVTLVGRYGRKPPTFLEQLRERFGF